MKKMLFDLHTHHNRCGHARGDLRDYIEAAINKKMDIIGISDHTPYFSSDEDQPFPHIAMGKSQFSEYVSDVLKLKEEYKGQIEVLLGMESDFFPKEIDVYRSYFERYPFDYIIGSVHHVDGISIFDKNRWEGLSNKEKTQTKETYYNLVESSAQSGLFQILGHIDAMKGYYPSFTNIQTEAVERTIKVIAKYDLAIEINTSGKTKDCGVWYPSDSILEMALFYGAKVTFGSDAHDPERVGDEFELVKEKLRKIGYKEWAYFRKKRMHLSPL